MAEFEKKVREILTAYGCYFKRRGKGDHDIWYSPITQRSITVDSKIKSKFTAEAIMKQAGIDKKF